jgi:hypothetical protein
VNGLYGGYMGEGAKTVIPSFVGAKVSFRHQGPIGYHQRLGKTNAGQRTGAIAITTGANNAPKGGPP